MDLSLPGLYIDRFNKDSHFDDEEKAYEITLSVLTQISNFINLALLIKIICMMYHLKLTLTLILKDTNEEI